MSANAAPRPVCGVTPGELAGLFGGAHFARFLELGAILRRRVRVKRRWRGCRDNQRLAGAYAPGAVWVLAGHLSLAQGYRIQSCRKGKAGLLTSLVRQPTVLRATDCLWGLDCRGAWTLTDTQNRPTRNPNLPAPNLRPQIDQTHSRRSPPSTSPATTGKHGRAASVRHATQLYGMLVSILTKRNPRVFSPSSQGPIPLILRTATRIDGSLQWPPLTTRRSSPSIKSDG